MIPLFKAYISDNAIRNVSRVLKSGFTGEGPEVKLFEKELKSFRKCKNLLYFYLSLLIVQKI